MNKLITVLVTLGAALLLAYSCFFVVDQRSHAIVFAFREIKAVTSEPGLHFKLPLIQNVVYLDKRILTMESNEAERFITAEKKNILVDTYVKWQIDNPKLFYVRVGVDEARAHVRLSQILKEALNNEITKHSVRDVISGERDKVMQAIKKTIADQAEQIGVSIVDVRLQHVDYVGEINDSVYERMKAERSRVANESRSTGFADSEKIRADADRQKVVILAEATKEAETIKGKGDAEAASIYSQGFGQSPEFYKFYRSLEAYRASFKNKSDVMVLDPSSEFFKYFKAPGASTLSSGGKK
ncbi:MAG: protease modulator HflC [Undibacterium sp.]|nr:protease modulator HflC [Undibacterium sp.]